MWYEHKIHSFSVYVAKMKSWTLWFREVPNSMLLLSIKMILFLVKKKLVYRNICSDKRLRSSFSLFTCDSLEHICVQVSRINCQPQEIFYTWVLVLFLPKMILETIKLLMLVFKCSHLASDT